MHIIHTYGVGYYLIFLNCHTVFIIIIFFPSYKRHQHFSAFATVPPLCKTTRNVNADVPVFIAAGMLDVSDWIPGFVILQV